MTKIPSSRFCNGIGVAAAIGSLAIAYFYMERHLGLEACPLCLIDRGIVAIIGLLLLLAFLFNPQRLGQRLLAVPALLFSGLGMAVCIRHLWLQSLPKDQLPECTPGLDYMLETFPLGETIHTIFTSAGECAEVAWTFLGLSIPAQTLLLFIGFAALSMLQILRRQD